MGSTAVAPSEYWGYLVRPDKSPSPLFEHLVLGIANYITRHIAPWDTQCLTPNKIASFYRLVGGNCDGLFLETPPASLSFIYQSLGCYHSLQPEKNPFAPPSIPALTAQGFVRWQTVQLLLQPEEHVPLLQEAVKRFEIINPADGSTFPRHLPREALPGRPDLEMTVWYESVSEKLLLEAEASQARNAAIHPSVALSDEEAGRSIASASIDSQSIVDATGHSYSRPLSHLSGTHRARPSHISSSNVNFRHVPSPYAHSSRNSPNRVPWSADQRRNSSVPPRQYSQFYSGDNTPTDSRAPTHTYRARARSPSISSASSTSCSSASLTTDSALSSPGNQNNRRRSASPPPFSSLANQRRHSSSSLPHDYYRYHTPHRLPPTNQVLQPAQEQTQTSYFESPPPRTNPNTRGLNVRWRDVNRTSHHGSAPGTPGEEDTVRHRGRKFAGERTSRK